MQIPFIHEAVGPSGWERIRSGDLPTWLQQSSLAKLPETAHHYRHTHNHRFTLTVIKQSWCRHCRKMEGKILQEMSLILTLNMHLAVTSGKCGANMLARYFVFAAYFVKHGKIKQLFNGLLQETVAGFSRDVTNFVFTIDSVRTSNIFGLSTFKKIVKCFKCYFVQWESSCSTSYFILCRVEHKTLAQSIN